MSQLVDPVTLTVTGAQYEAFMEALVDAFPEYSALARMTRGLSRSSQPLKLKQLDVAISPVDPGSCLVELAVDLGTTRGGLLAGVFGGSGVLAAGWTATVWATAIADPLMLVGVPVVAGAWVGTRAIFRAVRRSNEEKLELLLDKLEHDEL